MQEDDGARSAMTVPRRCTFTCTTWILTAGMEEPAVLHRQLASAKRAPNLS